jgi:hypothetical protein
VFVVALWMGASFICLLCEGALLSEDAESQTTLDVLLNCQVFTADDTLGKFVGVFNPDLWTFFARCVTFDFAIFYGDWVWFRYMLLVPIMAGIVATMIYSAARLVRGGG